MCMFPLLPTARECNPSVRCPGQTNLSIVLQIPYLRQLGINCVEVLPVFEWDELEFQRVCSPREHMVNIWGYSHLSFMAVASRLGSDGQGPAAAVRRGQPAVGMCGTGARHLWMGYKQLIFARHKVAPLLPGEKHPFTPHAPSLVTQAREFKELVRELHIAGIEVIMDVVFNHTAEGVLEVTGLLFLSHDWSSIYECRVPAPPTPI